MMIKEWKKDLLALRFSFLSYFFFISILRLSDGDQHKLWSKETLTENRENAKVGNYEGGIRDREMRR